MKKVFWMSFCLMVISVNIYADDFLENKVAAIGSPAPLFELETLDGDVVSLADLKGETVFIHFWSAKCPYVVRYEDRLEAIVHEYQGQGVRVLGINSNVTETVEQMKSEAEKRELSYDVLVDPGYEIADLYGAITTPHVYIINPEGILVYEGAIDDQGWNEDNPVTKKYAREAIESVLVGAPVMEPVTKTVGCTVKRN